MAGGHFDDDDDAPITQEERETIEHAFQMVVPAPLEEVSYFWHATTLIAMRDSVAREGAAYVSFTSAHEWRRRMKHKRAFAKNPGWQEGNAILEAFSESHHAIRLTPGVARKLLPIMGKLVGAVELLASLDGGTTGSCAKTP